VYIYLARRVLPVATPPLRDGAVAVEDGRIVAVGPRKELVEQLGDGAATRDLGDVVLMPGLVNAHTHLELSWLGSDPPAGGDYTGWVRELLRLRETEDAALAAQAAQQAVDSLVERGTVAVGDISNGVWIAPLLARSPLHGIVFHEIYGMPGDDPSPLLEQAAERLQEIEDDPDVRGAAGRLQLALTPHAPHSTSSALLRGLAGRARAADQPLSIHVAESEAESQLLREGKGPLAELFRERSFLPEGWEAPGFGPVEYLDRIGLLSSRTLAVHCVRLVREDHSRLQSRRATVITCPRSNERLGVGKAPVPELLREGIPVALGTDSLASAPDLDLFGELAALCDLHPGLAPATALRMATLNGARGLGLDRRLGSIEPGKLAGLVVLPMEAPDDDPFELACSLPAKVHPLATAPWEAVG